MFRFVVVKFTVPGYHNWPKAPKHVSYLRAKHRHLFYFKVWVDVDHGDREVEFHTLRALAIDGVHDLFPLSVGRVSMINFGHNSCEHIAEKLRSWLYNHKVPVHCIEVWEDAECGALVM